MLSAQPALDAIGLAVAIEHHIDLADLGSRPEQVGRGIEILLVNRLSEEQRVAQALDQRGFAMPVSSGDAVHAWLEINGHAVALRTFAVGLDVLQANGPDDHADLSA